MDPKDWPEPEKFRPERWLDSEGQFYKHERFIPFSIGKLLINRIIVDMIESPQC